MLPIAVQIIVAILSFLAPPLPFFLFLPFFASVAHRTLISISSKLLQDRLSILT
jgi:hypothetical protein